MRSLRLLLPLTLFVAAPLAGQTRTRRAVTDQPRGQTDDVARRVLGMSLSISGSPRDTLGLLVTAITPSSAADQAGIDTGNRVAEINGASLRVLSADIGRPDAEDGIQRRLARSLRAVHPGDDVEVRVVAGGRARRVTLHLAKEPEVAADPAPAAIAASAPSPSSEAAPAAVALGSVMASPPTLNSVVTLIAQAQAQLRQLAQQEGSLARADSLSDAEHELELLRRRLRVQARTTPPTTNERTPRNEDSAAEVAPGLRLSSVAEGLASYFGDGSERGLLVLHAEDTWDPLRTGDVIMLVDGATPDMTRLKDALASRRELSIELLRRKRTVTVVLSRRE